LVERAGFLAHEGEAFADLGAPARTWTLAVVSDLRRTGDFESYSLELTADPIDPPVVQGMLTLGHHRLGRVELFVVPIAPGRVEAVFNALARRAADDRAEAPA
jgi:hypothetical protein